MVAEQQSKYNSKIWFYLAHALWIILFFLLPSLLRPDMGPPDQRHPMPDRPGHLWVNPVQFCSLLLFYINAYWLMPRYFYRRPLYYVIIALSAILLTALIAAGIGSMLFHAPFSGRRIGPLIGMSLFPACFMLVLSITFRFISDQIRNNRRIKEIEADKLQAELSFLRSQVSPHFMFNILNSLVSLARKKSDLLEPALIKMSHLLHYMLYESTDDRINLQQEIEYIQNFNELQTLRFGSVVRIRAEWDVPDAQAYEIAPMLLIPFVENAFKHGIGAVPDPEIRIRIWMEKDSPGAIPVLHLVVSNTLGKQDPAFQDKSSGIGLANVKRRLDLIYPGAHQLRLVKTEQDFTATLEITLL